MHCPVCKAENALETTCRSCKADLSLLAQVETQRGRALAAAWRLLRDGRPNAALQAAALAHEARAATDSAQLLALCHLWADNFALALRWRQACATGDVPAN